MKQSFEEYLSDRCPCHTNNSPEGFDNWLEQLDGEQYISYGMDFALKCFTEGKIAGIDRSIELLKTNNHKLIMKNYKTLLIGIVLVSAMALWVNWVAKNDKALNESWDKCQSLYEITAPDNQQDFMIDCMDGVK